MSTSVSTTTVERPASPSSSNVPWTAIVTLACLAAAYLPLVWSYVAAMLELPHYGFVALLPVAAGVLAWEPLRSLGSLKPGDRTGLAAWLVPAVLGLLVAVILESPWFAAVAFLFALMGAAHAVGGSRLTAALLPAWIVLWMGIRLPLTADQALAQSLQRIAADRASLVLNTMDILHLRDGNVVETPQKRYMVEEACSGVQSLFAITACTVFFALWMRESWWRTLLLLAAAWWWVWIANVARVILVTYLNSQYGWTVDEGGLHDALGIALFVVTLGLIVSTEHLILFFLPRQIDPDRPGHVPSTAAGSRNFGRTVWPALGRTRLASVLTAAAFLGLAVLQWLPYLRVPQASATPANLDALLVADFAPPQIGGWQRIDAGYASTQRRDDSQWGARSQSWRYRSGSQTLTVSVDYPFRGWHELTECYEADGWLRRSRDVVEPPPSALAGDPSVPKEQFVRAVFHRPEKSDYGFLLCEVFNDRARPISVPRGGRDVAQRLLDRLQAFVDRVTTLGAVGSGVSDQTQSYQLQVFMTGVTPSTDEDRAGAARVLTEFRRLLVDKLVAGAKS